MEKLESYRDAAAGKSVPEVLRWALGEFGAQRIGLASAFGVESQIITHFLAGQNPKARIFTIDTGRLFQETYNVMQATMDRYGIRYEVYSPDPNELSRLMADFGPNLFRKSVDLRQRCCQIRKVHPLLKALSTIDAWIAGLREGQAHSRNKVETVEWDAKHGKYKVNPLAHWSDEQVWNFIREHDIPYNELQDYGYRSIGCACCTRAVASNEDVRAGRWWWEEGDQKECGLHPAPEYQI